MVSGQIKQKYIPFTQVFNLNYKISISALDNTFQSSWTIFKSYYWNIDDVFDFEQFFLL